MIINKIEIKPTYKLRIFAKDSRVGLFSVMPYMQSEVFISLTLNDNFNKIHNDGYFIKWDYGADLSADTTESKWQLKKGVVNDS